MPHLHRQFIRFAVMIVVLACGHLRPPSCVAASTSLNNALGFLRTQQQENGAFGQNQRHLQTGLAVLALLSVSNQPSEEDLVIIEKAIDYLLKTSSSSGDLGDDLFNTESHAVATTALLCAQQHLRPEKLRAAAAKRSERAVKHLIRLQDRSSSSASRGGWKMEGRKGRANDRRASGWALLAVRACQSYGISVPEANLKRAVRFMRGAFKEKADKKDQIGGFSVDTEGLAVDLISSMGGWVLARCGGGKKDIALNSGWLAQNMPSWSGPNYFYASFFRCRALKFTDGGQLYHETNQRIQRQIADHQKGDGSVGFPPGNARNTVIMGPAFSTAMAILILQVDDSRLPFDEDYRLAPLF